MDRLKKCQFVLTNLDWGDVTLPLGASLADSLLPHV